MGTRTGGVMRESGTQRAARRFFSYMMMKIYMQ